MHIHCLLALHAGYGRVMHWWMHSFIHSFFKVVGSLVGHKGNEGALVAAVHAGIAPRIAVGIILQHRSSINESHKP